MAGKRHLDRRHKARRRGSSFHASEPRFFQHHGNPYCGRPRIQRADTADSPKVAVINQSFVRKILEGGNPIAAYFQIEEEVGRARPIYVIVGLVRDTKYYDLRDEFAPGST